MTAKIKKTYPDNDRDFVIPSSPWLWVMNLGLLLVLAATAMPLLQVSGLVWRYLFCAGALLALVGRICAPFYSGSILRVRRLNRLELWSCIMFCAAGFFMWYIPERTDWLAFTLAGGSIQIYTSFMMARVLSKELKKRKGKSA